MKQLAFKFCRQFVCIPVAVAAGLLLTGCAGTFSNTRPIVIGVPPVVHPQNLYVGKIEITDLRVSPTEAANDIYHFRQGVAAWNQEHKAFAYVGVEIATNLPPDSLVMEGCIKNVEKGSQSLRFLVGMGAGQARLEGDFALKNASGKTLASFSAHRSYLGGAGIGGMDMMNFEDLFNKMGGTVADGAEQWLSGRVR